MKDELFFGEYAAEYYDKLMSGRGKEGYLNTKDSYKTNAELILKHLGKLKKGNTILELGCGTGNFCLEFAKKGLKVKGIELSDDLLKRAKKHPRITYQQGDMRDFNAQGFDYVVALFDTFRYNQSFSEARQALRCIKKSLTKNGVLLFDAYYTTPMIKPRTVSLPPVELDDGRVVQEQVTWQTKGFRDYINSVHYIYKNNKSQRKINVKRLPRLRLSHKRIKELLYKEGFNKIKFLNGLDGKNKEKIITLAQ